MKNNNMKTFFLLIFLISNSDFVKQNDVYIVKFKNFESIAVPGDFMLGKKKIAMLRKIHSMTDSACIGEIVLNKDVTLNSAMRFHYKQFFIGNSYVEVTVDSLKLSTAKKLSIRDTILIN